MYKIYTPLENFEENGVVAKLIFDEGVDFELSAQLSIYKVSFSLSHLFHFSSFRIILRNILGQGWRSFFVERAILYETNNNLAMT